ncbi:Putative permease of the major facilitator superfamily MFS1 [Spiribacter salinus M19-40]|jgi:MFS family permease|uniref:MFS transporter n=2 Tax=Spiribacter salinus TaxID=1335746 RepID=A0A540VW70_9GAMM|nr:MFS transporter [Spiribacter salinus]AGM41321.1 Putative permease of the major facilitator superfamily MFS1 [Spiribacter salinus M19-40]MBY5268911.1 MFS transporter permease [Spiribacter salinus]TQF01013.1 MAG: MFS transporter [Spiribacter salinus]
MQHTLSPFITLFTSIGLLLIGNGLLGTLLGVRMSEEAFATEVIGVVTACYSVGFVLATRVCPGVIVRSGHIRSFAAFAALAAISTLAYPLLINPWAWAGMRLLYGFSLAGLYMVTESWLNDRTPTERRGQVLGVYSIITYVGLGGGQFLLLVGRPGGFELFSLAAMLIALAVVPLSITRISSPELPLTGRIPLRDLLAASPLGLVGSALSGTIAASFLYLAPVYARDSGFSDTGIALLMGLSILGGFLLQWPIGHLSDRFNRRDVMMGVSLAVALTSLGIVYATGRSETAVVMMAVLWGGLAFTLYPIAVSLANDFLDPSQFLAASAGLLLVHGLGMIAGPLIATQLMALIGPSGLFWMLAGAGLVLAGFAWLRQRVGPPIPVGEPSTYRVVPRESVYAGGLDPRFEDLQLELSLDLDESPPDPETEP